MKIEADQWRQTRHAGRWDWEPESFPQWWSAMPDTRPVAFNRRDSATETVCVFRDGTEITWKLNWNDCTHNKVQITEDEAMALLDVAKPIQPDVPDERT